MAPLEKKDYSSYAFKSQLQSKYLTKAGKKKFSKIKRDDKKEEKKRKEEEDK